MTAILDGKVAIVTGAAKGLGHQIARRLGEAGATIVASDLAGDRLTAAAAQLDADAIACDVRDETQVHELVSRTLAAHGRLDVMVANAGVATVAPLTEMSLEQWRDVMSVDLDGVFLCTKHAGIAMAAGGGGSIITIASIKAFGGAPATGHYGAAKAGVVSLTKTAALEFRSHGVRVNAICPGWIDTDLVNDHKAELEAVLGVSFEDYIGHIQGRLGEPDEVAGLAVFLASERSRFSSGSAYIVDGGATASLV
ncbi:MAG: SDR family NAD(P)-dependent oxidoreductase [Solirubrobacteraceae bacterium]|jgi:NAD(P)-dependent dehydrogenase (short-subunit alcohol dehydrogenase family)